jgi:hypothetical protein
MPRQIAISPEQIQNCVTSGQQDLERLRAHWQTSPQEIEQARNHWLDRFGDLFDKPYNPNRKTVRATWEVKLFQDNNTDKDSAESRSLQAAKDLNWAFKDLRDQRIEGMVAIELSNAVTIYEGFKQNPLASHDEIEQARIHWLDRTGAHFNVIYNPNGKTKRIPWENNLLKSFHRGVGLHAERSFQTAQDLNQSFRNLRDQRKDLLHQRIEIEVETEYPNCKGTQ